MSTDRTADVDAQGHDNIAPRFADAASSQDALRVGVTLYGDPDRRQREGEVGALRRGQNRRGTNAVGTFNALLGSRGPRPDHGRGNMENVDLGRRSAR